MIVLKQCLSCGASLEHDSLVCGFCGMAHLVTGDGHRVACPTCGGPNPPDAKSCVQCRAHLALPCPECAAHNPVGSRFCHDCRIEFRSYRRASIERAALKVSAGSVERLVVEWLDGRWFKARDLRERLKLLERTLVWLPVWRFGARVEGKVQGQVSQTHYRVETSRDYDPETKRWVDRSRSVPYTVWNHVTKEFARDVALARPAGPDHDLYRFLGDGGDVETRPLADDEPLGGGEGERVFEPIRTEHQAYRALRRQSEADLRRTLLEKVELLDARYLGPSLRLVFYPVWDVLYRYKRSHGTVRIDGATARVDGKRVSLLDQWFG